MIAEARGFRDLINQSVLAKLMLAERFQPDFYDWIATETMTAKDGASRELAELEEACAPRQAKRTQPEEPTKGETKRNPSPEVNKWLERSRPGDWLCNWMKIDPSLVKVDLRPYVFVARDKRALSASVELGGHDELIAKLSGSSLLVSSAEKEVKGLNRADAEAVFAALREQLLRCNDFSTPPAGVEGLALVAKHHERFQDELVGLLSGLDPKTLGIWIVKGWSGAITDAGAEARLLEVLEGWARQDDNIPLKKAASFALPSLRKRIK